MVEENNVGKLWSEIDITDLRYSAEIGSSAAAIADFLMRTETEVCDKAAQLGIKLG